MGNKAKFFAAALTLSTAGLLATSTREGGFVQTAYRDPVGIPTVCAGHTGPEVKVGQKISTNTCERLLQEDTTEAQGYVKRLVHIKVTQGQYDELTDFTFNVGGPALASSTLLKRINAGDCYGAGAEFPKWNMAKGKVLRGLSNRRAENRKGWESGC